MRFAFLPAFLLLLAIPLLLRRWKRAAQPARLRFSLTVPAEMRGPSPEKILLALRVLALALMIAALARPQNSFSTHERNVSGIDIMMVMDVSASMSIEDLDDRARLDLAKETMENFVKGRRDDRIGFLIFSGEPLTLVPPTLDYGLVLKSLREASTGVLKDGTAIGDGLSLAVNRLRNSRARSKVIILLTDGDNNLGQIDPGTAGDLAAGYGIRVYTIAIGREGRVRMPQRTKGIFGNTITTYTMFENALNPELLEEIARVTHGKFFRVTEDGALSKVFQEIDQLEKSDVKSTEKVRYEEAFMVPLKLALLLLLLEQLLSRVWWRVIAA